MPRNVTKITFVVIRLREDLGETFSFHLHIVFGRHSGKLFAQSNLCPNVKTRCSADELNSTCLVDLKVFKGPYSIQGIFKGRPSVS